MNPRVKSAVLWGAVGLLSFLVLLQGYELLEGLRVDLSVKAGAAVVVFLATTVLTYLAQGRLPPSEPARGDGDERRGTPNDGSASDATADDAEER
jgi:hypothetical protein